MPEDVTTSAEPSSAEAPAAAPAQEVHEVPTDPKAYEQWRYGTTKPKAESAPAKRSESKPKGEAESDQASDAAAESEPATRKEQQPSKAERRLNELLEDLKRAGLSPSELKSFKRDAQKATAEPPKEQAKPAAPADPDEPKEPNQDDFTKWEDYEAAHKKWIRDLAKYEGRKAVMQDRLERSQEAAENELRTRVEQAKQRYGSEAESAIKVAATAIFQDAEVPRAVQAILNGSSVLVDVMYTIGKDTSDLEDFVALCKSDPGAAIRKAVLTEKLVMEELAKAGAQASPTRDEDGKFAAPDKKSPTAPPPPREVSGRSGAPRDTIQRAVETGDFATYRAEQNRRDLTRFRGQ